ncbi:MAG TPA: DUF5990 family protein [Streptosporangiaceae bacterium]|jgi:hypothetical protein
MPQLPDRPDLAQLRRQAREMQRAAAGGDPAARRRVQQVSAKTTLSAAQLALAREYGFASWATLKDEAERRRASAPDTVHEAPAPAEPWRGLLAADGDDDPDALIAGQYADRPQLRPILDAVLAVVPGLGPVTVQARRTLVTLFTPRRAFAAVRATTRNRVDLGLRLDDAELGGRLLAAGNVGGGGVTVRVALTRPQDVDGEVRDLMRRAYAENSAPPPPPRPARRSGATLGTLAVVIEGSELPGRSCRPEPDGQGHENVHVALYSRVKDRPALTMPGNPWTATEPVPGDAAAARWEAEVTVKEGPDGGFDFAGPFVRGVRDDRHLGLAWGDLPGDGTLRLFRGAKLRLVDVDPGLIKQALRPGHKLVARIRLTDTKGNPICARVHPPYLTWSVTAPSP